MLCGTRQGLPSGLFPLQSGHELRSAPACRRLLLVDGHAFAYRAFFAIRRLSSPTGAPTNAIYGFIKMLEKMRATLAPTHLLVVWDGGLAAERTAAHPEYKSQRAPMPADLEKQIEALQLYLPAAGLGSYCEDGVEADDWIAAMTRHALAAGLPVVIASTDKDFMPTPRLRAGRLAEHQRQIRKGLGRPGGAGADRSCTGTNCGLAQSDWRQRG